MNCKEARQLIECYSDGELDAVRAQDIEGHLEICAVCLQTLESQRSLHRVLANPNLYSRADSKVSRDIRSALRRIAAEESRPGLKWWRWLAPGLVAVCVVALALVVTRDASMRRDMELAEITSAHVRSLLATHLTDVASEDRHTVKPWFTGKLDFAPPVKDLSDAGFVLVGGRIDYLNHRAVAALIYKHQRHVVNVFIWPTGRQPITTKSFVRDGFNVVHWSGAQMDFWAVSDLNGVELEKLQRLLTD